MHTTNLDHTNTQPVNLEGVSGVSMRIVMGRPHDHPNFSMRHFVVEPGGHTPRHSHDYEHQVIVLEGSGEAEHDGETINVNKGDVLYVEPDKLHQFRNTGSQPLQFICMVPQERIGGGEVPGS